MNKPLIRDLNLAELRRQLERAQNELRLLEGLSSERYYNRWAIAHYRELTAKLTKSINQLA